LIKLNKIDINIRIKLLLFYLIKMVIIIIYITYKFLIWVAATYPCVCGLVGSTLDVMVIDVGLLRAGIFRLNFGSCLGFLLSCGDYTRFVDLSLSNYLYVGLDVLI
jgi:hypothetical protein